MKEIKQIKQIKQIKVLMCIVFIVLAVSACGNDGDKEVQQIQVQKSETENEDVGFAETREEFAESDVEYTELDTEPEAAIDCYEPTEVSKLDYDSFQKRMTDEEWEGFEQYFPVLKENAAFELASVEFGTELNKEGETVKEGEPVVFCRNTPIEVTDIDSFTKSDAEDDREVMMIYEMVYEVRVFDLDGDGIQELILEWTPLGDFLILHRENENFYGYTVMCRGFQVLQTNGIFLSSGGANCNHWRSIRFDHGSWLTETLAVAEWGEYYLLNGDAVDEDTYRQQVDSYLTEDVTGYKPKRSGGG